MMSCASAFVRVMAQKTCGFTLRFDSEDMVQLSPGLGLTNEVIVDQHFRQRGRLGRLLAALSYNPRLIGIGLDEDTAAFIDQDRRLEVVGSGALTIVDPTDMEFSSMDSANRHDPVSLINVRIHVLVGLIALVVCRSLGQQCRPAQDLGFSPGQVDGFFLLQLGVVFQGQLINFPQRICL